MSILSSIGNIVKSTASAVGRTGIRAVSTAPLIVANVVAKDAPIVKSATKKYLDGAYKDAGTTLSVASSITLAGGIKTAIAKSTSVIAPKILASVGGLTAGGLTTLQPAKAEKVVSSAPKQTKNIIEYMGEGDVLKKIAYASLVPAAVVTAYKAPAIVSAAKDLLGFSSKDSKENKSAFDYIPKKDNVPTTNATEPYLPVPVAPKSDYALAGGTSSLPMDNNQVATPQTTYAGNPVLEKDKKKRKSSRRQQPINIRNRVGVEVRNIYKPEVTYKKSYVRSYKHITNRSR